MTKEMYSILNCIQGPGDVVVWISWAASPPCPVGWFSTAGCSCLDVDIERKKSLLEYCVWFGLIYPRITEGELGKY